MQAAGNKRLATSMSKRGGYTPACTRGKQTSCEHSHSPGVFESTLLQAGKASLATWTTAGPVYGACSSYHPAIRSGLADRPEDGLPAAPPRSGCGHKLPVDYQHLHEVLCTMADAGRNRPQSKNFLYRPC